MWYAQVPQGYKGLTGFCSLGCVLTAVVDNKMLAYGKDGKDSILDKGKQTLLKSLNSLSCSEISEVKYSGRQT
jgi:hypothetical protein